MSFDCVIVQLSHSSPPVVVTGLRSSNASLTTGLVVYKSLGGHLVIFLPGEPLLGSTKIIEFELLPARVEGISAGLFKTSLFLLMAICVLPHLRLVHGHCPRLVG